MIVLLCFWFERRCSSLGLLCRKTAVRPLSARSAYLTDRPNQPPGTGARLLGLMDALAEILRAIKVDSAIYLNGVFSEPWCVASPGGRKLAPVFGSDGHIIIYHLLCEGHAYCEVDGEEPVQLVSGDLIA